jgi:hypothetical protein
MTMNSGRVFETINSYWSLVSLIAAGDKSNSQSGLNPVLAKNGNEPIISTAWLLAVNSANSNHSDQSSYR